jgi:phage terminase small subunit
MATPTERQELFIAEYVKTRNGFKSAVKAGYRENSARQQASRLLTKEHILKRVEQETQQIQARNNLDADYIVNKLRQEAEGITPDATASSRVKALDQLAKIAGVYAPVKSEVEANINQEDDWLANLDEEEDLH